MDYPISELRIVKVYFRNGDVQADHHSVHYMHQSQVDVFVKATLELHFSPRINPHSVDSENNGKTSELWEIWVNKLDLKADSLWWTTPGLCHKNNPRSVGAKIHKDYLGSKQVWAHPELLEQYRRAEAEED